MKLILRLRVKDNLNNRERLDAIFNELFDEREIIDVAFSTRGYSKCTILTSGLFSVIATSDELNICYEGKNIESVREYLMNNFKVTKVLTNVIIK